MRAFFVWRGWCKLENFVFEDEWEEKYKDLRKKREEAEEKYLLQKRETVNYLDYLSANENSVDQDLQNEWIYKDKKLKEIYENRKLRMRNNIEAELENLHALERQYIQENEQLDEEERQIKKDEMKALEEREEEKEYD